MMLNAKVEIPVRFSEIDSLGILWHGHYIRYFEDGREAFGREFQLGYMDVYALGFSMPVVKVSCDYKVPIRYNDKVYVETTFRDTPAAKILFDYRICLSETGKVLATGKSEQVFLDRNLQLHLTIPPFFAEWKIKHGITPSKA